MRRGAAVLVAALALLLTGCSQADDYPVGPGPTLKVQKSDYGKRWPVTVDSGTLRCAGTPDYGAVTLQTENGRIYALNAPAAAQKLGRPVAEIWADDPEAPGSKKEIGLLVAAGLKLCQERASASPTTASPSAS